jgi:Flp pilus assembly protein TadD
MVEMNPDRAPGLAARSSADEACCPEYEAQVATARQQILDRDFVRAGEQLRHAASLDLRRPEAFNLLGVIEFVRGRRLDALRWWRVAVLLDGSYQPAQENLERVVRRPWPPGRLQLG